MKPDHHCYYNMSHPDPTRPPTPYPHLYHTHNQIPKPDHYYYYYYHSHTQTLPLPYNHTSQTYSLNHIPSQTSKATLLPHHMSNSLKKYGWLSV